MSNPKPLVLVDGSSYVYRAFHAMPALTNSKGRPTGAVYGMTNMLRRLLHDFDPEYVAVVFDASGKTFRDELYEQYKANRAPMPEELAAQLEPIKQVIDAMGIPMLEVPGVEADDVIGTLAVRAKAMEMTTVISTGDKDLAQLVNEQVTLVNTMDNSVLDPEGVERKFGVPPALIVDYLTLIGDSVDNVPGVPKVGPKTAQKLLDSYGSADGVMAHADEVKGVVGENLRRSLDHLPLSRELLTIRCDLALEQGPRELARRSADQERLRQLFTELEFKTWLGEILEAGDEPVTAGEEWVVSYEAVMDDASLERWLEKLAGATVFAFDTETTGLDYMSAELVGVSFAVTPHEAAYVPLAHRYPGAPPQLDRAEVLERLRPLLEDADAPKLGQNLKFDMSILARYGIELRGVRFDTMLESYVLDSTASRHDMDSLALKYLGYRTIHFEEVAGKGAKQITFDQVPLESAVPYAAEDADISLRLHQTLRPRLEAEPSLARVFDEIEMPIVPVLSRMERHGVMVDRAMLAAQSTELAQRMEQTQGRAHDLVGRPFNLGSPKQIQEVLFEEMGLPVRAKTPKGQPSTAEGVLQDLAADYELPRLILEHRALSKLRSTYTEALPARVNVDTGRVHTSYHQAVAATGRLSSSEPNLQNIPVRTPEGRRIRQAFVAPDGHRLIAADYSQIELRIMAHLSADPGLLKAFEDGVDIHRATAAEVFGVGRERVSDEQRRSAKAINFGLIYGMSAFGLARQLGIERDAAQRYVDLYFARYPGVRAFMDTTRQQAHERGYVETVFGRRLYLPEINSRNGQRRQYAERTAINAPMQGTAADIIKRAMVRVDRWISQSRVPARMIMQVHDELVFEVETERVDQVASEVADIMTGAAELAVPLVVDVGVGENWDQAH